MKHLSISLAIAAVGLLIAGAGCSNRKADNQFEATAQTWQRSSPPPYYVAKMKERAAGAPAGQTSK